jgi:hypothetical protein
MRSSDLTRQQLSAIGDAITPALQYLNKLLRRMQHRNFPDNDRVWQATRDAQRAMLKLSTELRTIECEAQSPTLPISRVDRSVYRVGRPRRESH